MSAETHCACEVCRRFRLQQIALAAEVEEMRGEVRKLKQQLAMLRGRVNSAELVA